MQDGGTGTVTDPVVDRCAAMTRNAAVDPVGTAGYYDGYLLVEQPLPWPRDVSEHPAFAPVVEAIDAAGKAGRHIRLQAIVPTGPDPAERRIVHYRRPEGPWFGGFVGEDHVVADADVADRCRALLDEPAPAAAPAAPGADAVRDVLVCTHGSRDRCCGSLGTSLFLTLDPRPGARFWRTSHTGGHRFAPTGITLPDGCAWAYLDESLLDGILSRSLTPDEVAPFFRGSSGIGSPEVQAAEREGFRTVGWEWMDRRRRGTVVRREADHTVVEVELEGTEGTSSRFRAEVHVARFVPVPDCGAAPETATKGSEELAVTSFTEI